MDELDRFSGFLNKLESGELHGILIKGFLKAERLQSVVGLLEAQQHGIKRHRFAPNFPGWTYGLNLDLAPVDLTEYTEQSAQTIAAMDALFGCHILERVQRVLSELAAPLPVQIPNGKNGKPYLSLAIRCLPTGGKLPPHIGNEQKSRPPYWELNQHVDSQSMMSHFLMLQNAVSGGALRVYNYHWSQVDERCYYRGRISMDSILATVESFVIEPEVGDLLVFDGGSWVHEVCEIEGERTRWTMGGFLSFSKNQDAVWMWT